MKRTEKWAQKIGALTTAICGASAALAIAAALPNHPLKERATASPRCRRWQ